MVEEENIANTAK